MASCLVTGGLPSVHPSADEVYRLTYPRVAAKNAAFQRRNPGNVARLAAIADLLDAEDVRLPDRLTVRRLQTLRLDLGMQPGAENIHWLLDEAFEDAAQHRLTDHFLAQAMALTSYHTNPRRPDARGPRTLDRRQPGMTATALPRLRAFPAAREATGARLVPLADAPERGLGDRPA